jgi:hypothetical protein
MAKVELTLATIEAIGSQDVFIGNALRRLRASTYDDFVDVLYDDLRLAVERLEQNPQHYPDEHEDATTQRLLDILFGMSYSASHDAQSGGCVDITVELSRKGFRWIGEAKRFNSVGDMREGYLQLATRYTPGNGSLSATYGGLVGYLRRENSAKCMSSWMEHFKTDVNAEATISQCSRRGPLGFISEHEHSSLGIPFHIWHFCVSLHFDPQDKSGRTAKKYK